MSKNLQIRYDIYTVAPAAMVWKEIVDPDMTKQWVHGTRLESKLKKALRMHTSARGTSRSSTARSSR
jgi:uncharacterized protein YndB with AHSA1/START domain